MAAIVTEHFRRNNVLSFIDDIKNSQNNYYLGIGKSDKWGPDESLSTLNIPIPTGTYAEENDTLSNLISCIKINQNDVGLVIPNVKFNVGSIYKAYTPLDPDCFYPSTTIGETTLNPCYATIGTRIYLCLANNNGAATINAPSATDYRAIQNADGYVWILVDNSADLFNTAQFISITSETAPLSLVNSIKNDGGGLLYGFSIKDGGIGYTGINSATFTAQQVGNATPIEITCGVTANAAGTIESVTLPSGYSYTDILSKNIIGGAFTFTEEGTGAIIIPNIAPVDGFAYEPSRTLPAWYAGISIDVVDNISNDGFFIPYRQISVIKNLEYDQTLINVDTLGALRYLIISSAPAVTTAVGEIISFDSSVATAYFDSYAAVDVDGDTEHRIYFHQNNSTGYGAIPSSGTFTNSTSVTAIAYSSVEEGEYVQHSGDIVFMENRKLIARQSGQTEEIKIIIQF